MHFINSGKVSHNQLERYTWARTSWAVYRSWKNMTLQPPFTFRKFSSNCTQGYACYKAIDSRLLLSLITEMLAHILPSLRTSMTFHQVFTLPQLVGNT